MNDKESSITATEEAETAAEGATAAATTTVSGAAAAAGRLRVPEAPSLPYCNEGPQSVLVLLPLITQICLL